MTMGPFRSSTALLFRASPLARLKLLALPLTRPPASSASPPAFLLHVKRTPPTDINLKNDDGSTKDLPYVTRATVWAADQWAKLGQAEENTWKRKAFVRTGQTQRNLLSSEPSSLACTSKVPHPDFHLRLYIHRKWATASWTKSSSRCGSSSRFAEKPS